MYLEWAAHVAAARCSRGGTDRVTPCETAWNWCTLEWKETASNSLILWPQSSKFKSSVISGMMKSDSLGGSSFGAHEREHQPGNWYRQARGIETHSVITRAVQEGELYLPDTSANNETSKRAHPFIPQLCSAMQKRQGSFPLEVCHVSLPWGRSSESRISVAFQKGIDLPVKPLSFT